MTKDDVAKIARELLDGTDLVPMPGRHLEAATFRLGYREALKDLLKRLSDEPIAECVPVDGDLDARGVSWRLVTMEPVTPNELRAIASQIHAAATAIEHK